MLWAGGQGPGEGGLCRGDAFRLSTRLWWERGFYVISCAAGGQGLQVVGRNASCACGISELLPQRTCFFLQGKGATQGSRVAMVARRSLSSVRR